MKSARRYTSADGLSLHYAEWAPSASRQAPDILCLPGLTRHSADFDWVAQRLSAYGHRVIAPDLRGRGQSEYARDVSTYAPPFYLDDLRALTIAARLERFVVIGTSFGGLLAMALATMLPAQVAGLVVNDIGPDIAQDGAKRILDYISVDRPQPGGTRRPQHCASSCPTCWRTTPKVGTSSCVTPIAKATTASCTTIGM